MAKYYDFSDQKISDNIVLSLEESSKTVDQIKKAEKVGKIIFTVFTYIFILALAFIVIFPFYWMIITSLKQNQEIISDIQELKDFANPAVPNNISLAHAATYKKLVDAKDWQGALNFLKGNRTEVKVDGKSYGMQTYASKDDKLAMEE